MSRLHNRGAQKSAQMNIDLLSDGTGETALAVLKAVLVQYDHQFVKIRRHRNIRGREQIESIVRKAAEKNPRSLLVYTVVLSETRNVIRELCEVYGVQGVDLLADLISVLDSSLDSHPKEAGILRSVNEDYFKRISAMEYSLKHDDGQLPEHIDLADIILVGVSRTGKTPLSIFLSYKGWKVANIPIVYNLLPPESLFQADQKKIVALTINPEYLFKIRKNRLERVGYNPGGSYADRRQVYREVDETQQLFQRRRWPVLNVTERALEETAGEIIRIVSSRRKLPVKIL